MYGMTLRGAIIYFDEFVIGVTVIGVTMEQFYTNDMVLHQWQKLKQKHCYMY